MNPANSPSLAVEIVECLQMTLTTKMFRLKKRIYQKSMNLFTKIIFCIAMKITQNNIRRLESTNYCYSRKL
jgi:hypothetical protein